jgi:hypothetical protein
VLANVEGERVYVMCARSSSRQPTVYLQQRNQDRKPDSVEGTAKKKLMMTSLIRTVAESHSVEVKGPLRSRAFRQEMVVRRRRRRNRMVHLRR